MTTLRNLALCVSASTLLLGACGPALEEEESALAEILNLKAEKHRTPDLTELDTVSQMTFVGDLGNIVAIPVATYPTTCTASNQWATTCGSGASRDISYLWTVPATGSYRFSTINSNFDTVLEIRNYNNTAQVLGCNDDEPSSLQSRVSLANLARGTRLLITIEGYEGDCGSTHLNIAKN